MTAVLLPVGIAYAVASSVPAICGLYATIFGLLAYALFGPSRMLVLGPDSSLVTLILGIVLPLSAGDPQRAMALAGMLAIVSGSLCVLAGSARLGFITELLSKPIRYGYMNGIALTVLVSQVPPLFGFTVKGDGLLNEAQAIVSAVLAGRTNGVALALGLGTLLMIGLLRHSRRVPGVLLSVVATTVIVTALNLATRFGVTVLGPLPRGLPALAVPSINTGEIVPVLLGACRA
ncbi:hypothetical protein KQ310_04310 [Synechococcus sp. CS-1328]|nr:hypothetical protein [Synechococcus sp. CS-1328]